MSTAYLTLKLLHILLAITAVGANITYGVWFARANMNPAFAPIALRGIAFLDNWIANPAYVLMLPTGAAMVHLAGYGFGTRWISWAMALWLIAIVLAYAGYTPSLRAQIRAVDAEGIASPKARGLAVRGQIWAGIIAIIVVVIIVLMVFKPS